MKQFLMIGLISFIYSSLMANNVEDADVVYLKSYTHVTIDVINNVLSIREDHYTEKLFRRNLEQNAKENIYFSEFDKVSNLEASVMVPYKKSLKEIKIKEFKTGDEMESGIFYSGYKNTSFVYPQLTENAIGKLKYTKTVKDPHFIKPFYFQDIDPVMDAKYSVTFPNHLKLKHLLFGEHEGKLQMKEEVGKKTTTITWQAVNVESYKFTENAPSRTYTTPHIALLIESYQSSFGKINVSSDVEDLYNWYSSLIQKVKPCDKENVKAVINEIITPEMSKEEAQKVVYKWVQDNIKYIAFEDGMSGFVPRSACDVLQKRYGDCKDMANLLYTFYTEMGIKAHIAWIGTRSKPYTYAELPSTVADNHMICAISENDTTIFLDATNPFSSFGMPTSMIQGKEALLAVNANEYKVEKVPEIDALDNLRSDSVVCELEGRSLKGKFSSSFKGYSKEAFQVQNFKAEISHNKKALRDFIAIGENSVEISNDSTQGFSNLNESGQLYLDFKMPEYAKKVSNRYYVNLNLHKQKVNEKLDEKRTIPFEKKYKETVISKVTLKIPDGFTVSYLPESQTLQHQYGGIETSYELQEDKVIYIKKFTSNFLLMPSEGFAEWNNFMQKVSEINHENIILKATL
ncbi:DUF3857 domain-containing protein [Flammeovirga aprica]|uniref:DUF3857 and transglutaminase domain-containing protein n=1 Tax=Flammeovirga aprica JL-4 TaxID=694437 RepID=A0A7X9S088_9BACT|nr:DUF3857 domain-containing protein [Flammeovirga aprica]NME72047.1 DUF3857 and transglutaminase domain-containing protein [Flammeovirga aprica JL-4]